MFGLDELGSGNFIQDMFDYPWLFYPEEYRGYLDRRK